MADTIGRYEIIRLLGQGGMARVYLARDPEFGREVAIKVLPAQLAEDANFLERFRREARTIAALEHPAIVPVYDFGQHNGQPYLVMRYMPGGTLAERLTGGRSLTLDQASVLFERLAPALDEVHRRGIVHRDLKPGNILFDQANQPYLSDFGIVKLEAGDAATLTALGGALGTPAYMSPEQARGDAVLDGRSDIYAMGVILYQVLAGALPYQADTPVGMAVAHISRPIPDITAAAPGLPPAAQTVIAGAMAKDPANRPATAVLLAENVSRLAAGRPLVSGEETVLEGAAVTGGGAQTTMLDGPPPMGPPPAAGTTASGSGGGMGRILSILGLILLLAVSGYLALNMRNLLSGPTPLAAAPTPAAPAAAAAGQEATAAAPTATATATQQAAPLATPVPPIGSTNTYVEYILDASGSMMDLLDGKTKLAIAQDVLGDRLALLPPDINAGLRVYGHRLPWENNEEASCDDIELVVPIGPSAAGPIGLFLPNLQAKGMTPMTESIRQAAADFTFTADRNNLIVLLSDGIETCDEEPAEAVKFLQELGIDFTIHVIGLDVDEQTRAQLQALADAAGGVYHNADSEEDLSQALGSINETVVESALAAAVPGDAGTTPPAEVAVLETEEPVTATSESPTETALPPTETPTQTAVPPTAEPTKTSVNATFEGSVSASSTYQGFPASLSLDGSTSTSWFSAGSIVDGDLTSFEWTGAQDDLITAVTIISNANHSEPSFRTGYGFESVQMQVLDASGQVVYEERAGLRGTPDPDVTFNPNVTGSTIRLNFSGHEAPDCGGFSELQVFVER